MNKVLNEKLINQILSVVACIPVGEVATYGQIARLIGREKNARLVGRVLSQAGLYGTFKTNGCVDLKKHQWKPTINKV